MLLFLNEFYLSVENRVGVRGSHTDTAILSYSAALVRAE
jgi:hypothetical protein